jgi:Tfp pilus assembly protein PilF
LTDIGAVASVGDVDSYDMDLLLVAEPAHHYRLRFPTKALAIEAAQRLTDLRRERLDGLPDDERVWWLIKHADAVNEVGAVQRAAETYHRVAQTGVQPHASAAALNYGISLKKAGSVDEAREYFLQALNTGAAKIAAYSAMRLGFDARDRGDDARARDYFARAEALGEPRGAEVIELMDVTDQAEQDQ